jgi:hypothetical protein
MFRCTLHGCCTIKEDDSGIEIICVWFYESCTCEHGLMGAQVASPCLNSDKFKIGTMGLGSTWNPYCFPDTFKLIPVKYIKYVGCVFLVSRHWSWVLITCTLCLVQGLKISPHTIHTDTSCYYPNFLQAVTGIIPWSCSTLFIFTSQLQLQVYMRSIFSVKIYETPATCCGCT